MSNLKKFREKFNLTQEELSDKSNVSVRTIQRIEAGTEPKGQTLKMLSRALDLPENELLKQAEESKQDKLALLKIINLSSLPFILVPPVNIAIPLLIMSVKKEFNPMAKQIVTIQILWTIIAFILFMLSSFMKNWFSLGNKFILIVMILLVLSNFLIILRNIAEIDKKGKLFFELNFSII